MSSFFRNDHSMIDQIEKCAREIRSRYASLSHAEQIREGPMTLEVVLHRILCDESLSFHDKKISGSSGVLPFSIQQIPTLHSLAAKEARFTAKICSAVATRPVVTLFELQEEICSEEGIVLFSELGMGPSIACLPSAQQYFRVNPSTRIRPVQGEDFIHFLVFSEDALCLLNGNGDARDALNCFARYYEKKQLDSETSSSSSKEKMIGNTRELGIHLQNFPFLLNMLRQEVARTKSKLNSIVDRVEPLCVQHKDFYERLLLSIHNSLFLEHKKNPDWSKGVEPEVPFVVHLDPNSIRETKIPSFLYSPPRAGSLSGGLEIRGALYGACSLHHRSHYLVASSNKSDTSIAPPSVENIASRSGRRKRERISDDSSSNLVLKLEGDTCPSFTSILSNRSLLGLEAGNNTLSTASLAPDLISTGKELVVAETRRDVASKIDHDTKKAPLSRSQMFIEQANAIISQTISLSPSTEWVILYKMIEDILSCFTFLIEGDSVQWDLVVRLYLALADITTIIVEHHRMTLDANTSVDILGKLRSSCFLIMPHHSFLRDSSIFSHTSIHDSENCQKGDSGKIMVEVAAIVSPSTVCWHYVEAGALDNTFDGKLSVDPINFLKTGIFNRSLYLWFHNDCCKACSRDELKKLENFFLNRLSVPLLPTSLTWIASALLCRRLFPASRLTQSFSNSFYHAMEWCCLGHYRRLIRQEKEKQKEEETVSSGPDSDTSLIARVVQEVITPFGYLWNERGEFAVSVDDVENYTSFENQNKGKVQKYHTIREFALFPFFYHLNGAGLWLRGVDDLFYADPHFIGTGGLFLKSNLQSAPPLRLIEPFSDSTSNLHVIIRAILETCGVRSLGHFVDRRLSCPLILFDDIGDALHLKVICAAPFIAGFMKQKFSDYYSFIEKSLVHSLQAFAVVVGEEIILREHLCFNGYSYSRNLPVCIFYAKEQNCLYAQRESFSPVALAETLSELFMPYTPEVHLYKEILRFSTFLFSFLSRYCDSVEGYTKNDIDLALLSECSKNTAEWGVLVTPVSLLTDDLLPHSAVLSKRYQRHYPPGTDGMLCTTSSRPQTFGKATYEKFPNSSDYSSSSRNSLPVMPSLPFNSSQLQQWKSGLFRDGYSFLQKYLLHNGTSTKTVKSNLLLDSSAHTSTSIAPEAGEESLDSGNESVSDKITFNFTKSGASKNQRIPSNSFLLGEAKISEATPLYAVNAEAYVYSVLKKEYDDRNSTLKSNEYRFEVAWLNEDGERGTPYDIVVFRRYRHPPASSMKPHYSDSNHRHSNLHIECYIEVKCTSSRNRKDFELTVRELLFAARYGRAYKIYRVFSASVSELGNKKIKIYHDIIDLWHTGKATISGDIRVMPVD